MKEKIIGKISVGKTGRNGGKSSKRDLWLIREDVQIEEKYNTD